MSYKVAFFTLGCKVNTFETEALWNKLKERNYERVNFSEEADVYVINTCTVTQASDSKSRKLINQTAKRKPLNALLCIMGCYSQSKPETIADLNGVDLIIGNENKNQIADLIPELKKQKKQIINVTDIMQSINFDDTEAIEFSNTRAFVKIQDGCDSFCSYCIVPFVRGPGKSRDPKKTIELIDKVTNAGYPEIVLSGIHTGSYGRDINYSLTELIKDLTKNCPKLLSLRISSLEITEITTELIELLKNAPLCKHLHIPLQSGSSKILKAMNRNYSQEQFLDIVKKLKKAVPDLAISSDVMVGFPGETEADFEETVKVIEEVGFMRLHVFPYSVRENTVAEKLPNQIPEIIKKERAKKLRDLSILTGQRYAQAFIGKTLEFIPESTDGKYFQGYTTNYLRVFVSGSEIKIGEIIAITITKITKTVIYGQIFSQ
ncbi:MAG: tRNA (N(6)-L-threonylcarbamoyladenosine(37)-C(2))-methylthiotransferase MtaB [Erysipelotrichales bacterium]|nr:tRNA (N(6)-L-threonylcarbamoyladenosine(37)-C(2))-methylthiotransferase MtaB [Erysipelotrichales bacterium]